VRAFVLLPHSTLTPPTDIDDFAKAIDSVFAGKATILNRMRLACTYYDADLKKKGDSDNGKFPYVICPS